MNDPTDYYGAQEEARYRYRRHYSAERQPSYHDAQCDLASYGFPGVEPSTGQEGWPDSDETTHLDTLVESIDQTPADDPIANLFSDKKRFLEQSVGDTLETIYDRDTLMQNALDDIERQECKARERLFEVEDWHSGVSTSIDKLRSEVRKEVASLKQQKRDERVSCWRDVTRTKTDLRELMGEWIRERQKSRWLSDDGSREPGGWP